MLGSSPFYLNSADFAFKETFDEIYVDRDLRTKYNDVKPKQTENVIIGLYMYDCVSVTFGRTYIPFSQTKTELCKPLNFCWFSYWDTFQLLPNIVAFVGDMAKRKGRRKGTRSSHTYQQFRIMTAVRICDSYSLSILHLQMYFRCCITHIPHFGAL